jgi:hypothetical protein
VTRQNCERREERGRRRREWECVRGEERECNFIIRIMMGMLQCFPRATEKGVGTCERREERECNFIIRIMIGMLQCFPMHWEAL